MKSSKAKSRRLRVEGLEDRRVLAAYTVNDPLDYDPGQIDWLDNDYSLREAVLLSNMTPNTQIDFDPTVFGTGLNLTDTIELQHGELLITESTTIDASSVGGVVVDAGHGLDELPATGDGVRVFNIDDSSTVKKDVVFIGLTVTGGDLGGSGSFVEGGGIYSNENLTLQGSHVINNAAVADRTNIINSTLEVITHASGGGVWSNGRLVIEMESSVANNKAYVDLSGSDIGSYRTTARGGGLFALGEITEVRDSTVAQNQAFVAMGSFQANTSDSGGVLVAGGGIYVGGFDTERPAPLVGSFASQLLVERSTISDNVARWSIIGGYESFDGSYFVKGAGIAAEYVFGLTLNDSLVSGNRAAAEGVGTSGVNTVEVNGGGAFVEMQAGELLVQSSTITANSVVNNLVPLSAPGLLFGKAYGGGLSIDANATGVTGMRVDHTTIYENTIINESNAVLHDTAGGGLYASHSEDFGIGHTVLAGNKATELAIESADDLYARANQLQTSVDYSVVQAALYVGNSAPNVVYTADPQLGPLQDNGGPTRTHRPSLTSPVIDAGGSLVAGVDAPLYDQRGVGYDRIVDGDGNLPAVIDIGAVEVQGAQDTDGPRVANVIITSQSAVSQHTLDFDERIDGERANPSDPLLGARTGIQLDTMPVALADTIKIQFDEPIDPATLTGALTLIGMQTGNAPTESGVVSYDSMTNTATWTFTGWTLADQYALRLKDTVTDTAGNQLDGEWTNPANRMVTSFGVSQFPSGDSTSGGEFQFVATLMHGDADLDGAIGDYDLTVLLDNWGDTVDRFELGDWDGNGSVGDGDLTDLLTGWGNDLWSENGVDHDLFLLADLDGDLDVDLDDFPGSGATQEEIDAFLAQYGLDIEVVA